MGRFLYLTLTRLDISYSVQHLSQYLHQPRQPHYEAALHVLRYLKGTANQGLFYPTSPDLQLQVFVMLIGAVVGTQLGLLQASASSLVLR